MMAVDIVNHHNEAEMIEGRLVQVNQWMDEIAPSKHPIILADMREAYKLGMGVKMGAKIIHDGMLSEKDQYMITVRIRIGGEPVNYRDVAIFEMEESASVSVLDDTSESFESTIGKPESVSV